MGRTYNTVGYPYIRISAGDFDFTWRKDENRPDYFTSLTHQRYVSQANTAKINFKYAPKRGESPNKFEAEITNAKGVIEFQYGMAGRVSPVYQGLVHSYKPSFSGEGYLNYDLSVVSRAVTYNFTKIDDPTLSIRSKTQPLNTNIGIVGYVDASNAKAKNLLRRVKTPEEYRKKIGELGIPANSYEILQVMKLIIDKYCGDHYVFDVDQSDSDFELPDEECVEKDKEDNAVSPAINTQGKSPFDALNEIARTVLDKTSPETYFYKIVINDAIGQGHGSKGTVTIKRFSKLAGASYVFDWGSKNSDVLSWSPQYDGSIAIFKARGEQGEFNSSTISIKGTDEASYSTVTVPASLYEDVPSDFHLTSLNAGVQGRLNWFNENSQYVYKADLEVLGALENPLELAQTAVEVRPYINGQLHHTAGTYIVISITDKVSSQGLTTSLGLYRKVEEVKENPSKTSNPNGHVPTTKALREGIFDK